MGKITKAKKYKTLLKILPHNNGFNFLALLFGPFYFLRYRLIDLFAVFIASPMVIFPLLLAFKWFMDLIVSLGGVVPANGLSIDMTILLTIITNHVIISLMANRLIFKNLKKMVAQTERERPNAPIMYFSVSIVRLVTLSLFTLGFYQFYWMYKNWMAIKNHRKENISPLLRSWFFPIIFIYPLFKTLSKDFKSKFPYVSYSIAYILFMFLDDFFPYPKSLLVNLIAVCLQTLLLIPIQQLINDHNKKLNRLAKPEPKFHLGEIILIIFTLVILYPSTTIKLLKHKAITRSASLVEYNYKFKTSYPEICENYGYKMKNFSHYFNQKFTNEFRYINDHLGSFGLNIDEMSEELSPEKKEQITRETQYEMTNFKFIKTADDCRYIDEHPEEFFDLSSEYNNLRSGE